MLPRVLLGGGHGDVRAAGADISPIRSETVWRVVAAGLRLLPPEMVEKNSKASDAALVSRRRRLEAKKWRAIRTAVTAELGSVRRKDEGGVGVSGRRAPTRWAPSFPSIPTCSAKATSTWRETTGSGRGGRISAGVRAATGRVGLKYANDANKRECKIYFDFCLVFSIASSSLTGLNTKIIHTRLNSKDDFFDFLFTIKKYVRTVSRVITNGIRHHKKLITYN